LRDRLVAELDGLQSADEAASWAHRCLPKKNTLTGTDAELLEAGFRLKLAALDDDRPDDGLQQTARTMPGAPPEAEAPAAAASQVAAGGVRDTGKTIRLRDKDHLKLVSKQPCVVCGREPSDAHHLRFAQPRALGRKVSDEFTVPICRLHHRELHRHGDEAAWWSNLKIDPAPIAIALWQSTHHDVAFGGPASQSTQSTVTGKEVS
jgi:hypothetical protein